MQLIKVPGINSSKNTKGCRNSGNAIISGLEKIKSNEKGKTIDRKFIDLEEIHVDNEKLDQQESLIYENSLESFEKKDKLIFLGGDHSITYKTCHAFLDFCNKNEKIPCLIVFDAHPDVIPPEKNPTNEQWLSAIIDKGFPTENILLVGLRNSSPQELEFLKSNKIKKVDLNELMNNIEEVTDTIMEFSRGKELYISIDIDVVDPAFAPSTYSPETGGLTPRQILYISTRLNYLKNLRALDITEVDSEEDKKNNNVTVQLASKILAEFL